jgi:hypothetical protein
MRIEDSARYPGLKKVVIEPGEAAGLDEEVVYDHAFDNGATTPDGMAILQFPDEEETVWPESAVEDALNLHCGD